jgi:hypothetical protein
MENDSLKIAFSRVKEDILYLTNELNNIKYEIGELKSIIMSLTEKLSTKNTIPTQNQTIQHINKTYSNTPTDNPTVPLEIGGLKDQNKLSSIGNEGVPTNRQTNQQTNQQTHFQEENIEENLKKASNIISSLDYLKKEIRQKFKRLTPQEMTVFSSIYQKEEENPESVTYKEIAKNLNLSESSIRDYVLKIIDKGIPIKKQKIGNKTVLLSISSDLKKIATLATILQLREL